MKIINLLASLVLLTGCEDEKPEPEPETPEESEPAALPAPASMAAPIRTGRHIRGQLAEQKEKALERKKLVDSF